METTVEIRPATRADETALAGIDRATWDPSSGVGPRPGAGAAFFTERRAPEDTLVADDAGAVVGYVTLKQATKLESNRHVLTVNGIAVDPSAQGRGIGDTLIAAAARLARARGARRLTLRVLGSNPGAQHLYESAGFVVEGTLRGEFLLDGAYVDDVLMALDLNRGAAGDPPSVPE